MLNRTPLNACHRLANARMVDFGGWEMPLHYGSQIDEHHAVRRDAGMFDVSHMLAVDIEGIDAQAFLRGLLANNIDKLKDPGKALYSCMLNEQGGVIDDLIAYHFSPTRYRMVVNASTAEKDIAWMHKQAARFAVDLIPRRDLAMIAVQGPQARAKTGQALPETIAATNFLKPFSAVESSTRHGECFIARTGYTGEDGFEIMLPADAVSRLWNDLTEAGVQPAGLGARDTLRLEAGMNLYGNDMDETVSPLDAGLAWTVDFASRRNFVGESALLANGARHAFVGLLLLDGGVLRKGQTVKTAGGDGEITSGGFSPTLSRSIAFARLPLGTTPGDTVSVQVRDKSLHAKVVKLPFVRHGKGLL